MFHGRSKPALLRPSSFALRPYAAALRPYAAVLRPCLRATLLLVLAILAPQGRAVPSDLTALAQQIEHFPATRGHGTESARLAKVFDLYWAARMRVMPDLATYIGYSGVDDRLPDFSPEGLALRHRLPHLELAALDSVDRAKLTGEEQLNDDLLRRRLQLEIEGERFNSLDPWSNDYLLVDKMNDRLLSVLELPTAMPARTVADYENMLARLRGFPRLVEDGVARLDEGLQRGITPPRVTLRDVPETVLGVLTGDPLEGVLAPFAKFPETIPPAERERLKHAAIEIFRQQVTPAVHKLHDYLAGTYVPHTRESIAVSDLPNGKAYYAWLLRYYTTTDITPDAIHELGLSEVKRIRAEMDKTIAASGFKGSFKEFCEYLRTDPRFFYDKPEDLVAGYRDIAKRIDPELPKLFGRLPRLPYGVKAMDEGWAKSAPSALYNNGSVVAGRPGWMMINTYDLKARPKWGMESLTAHESVPGHHLQYSLVEELGVLPEWRRWDVYPAFSEGWGLYAERLGEELGLYKDPYSKFGQLNNEMWRAIRLVVDTGMQGRGWTRQQAIDYCRENSAKTDREIENEIDRYIVQPGSVPCYKVGELKLLELRRAAEKALGPKFDIRAFHDAILGNGQLPLDLLEQLIRKFILSGGVDPGSGHESRSLREP